MILYSYYRSSAAYRIRIALNLKKIDYDLEFVNLLKNEQQSDKYLSINPQGLVPALQLDDGNIINQSTAILEWLEENHPQPALLPAGSYERAKVRAAVNSIACDIHPLNNLRVLKYLSGTLDATDEQKNTWYKHWISIGFAYIEQFIANNGVKNSHYSTGDTVSMLDVYLIPQVYNALRFEVDMSPFPNIIRVHRTCSELDAFLQASPEQQPDS